MKFERIPADPDIQMPDEYYEILEQTMGAEAAAWARLPRAEREKELRWLHENFFTQNDLAVWPPELGDPSKFW